MPRWFRRVTYTFAILIACIGVMIGFANVWDWSHDSSRMGEGLLAAESEGSLVFMLNQLPGVMGYNKNDALHFVAMPSFSNYWYALEISDEGAAEAHGSLVVVERGKDNSRLLPDDHPQRARPITITHDAYVRMMAEIDRAAGSFEWNISRCLDGTPIAFERWSSQGSVSGEGNASCNKRYQAISTAVVQMVRASGALSVPPMDGDWMIPEEKNR